MKDDFDKFFEEFLNKVGDREDSEDTSIPNLMRKPKGYTSVISEGEFNTVVELNKVYTKLMKEHNKNFTMPDFSKTDRENIYPRIQMLIFDLLVNDLRGILVKMLSIHSLSGEDIEHIIKEENTTLEGLEMYLLVHATMKKLEMMGD